MKTVKSILAVAVLFTTVSYAKTHDKTYGNIVVDKVTSVYDGDTFYVNIKSFPAIIGKKMSIRVGGIDTPEMKGMCKKEKHRAEAARKFTKNFLLDGDKVELRDMRKGKYFRIVADVYVDNVSLADALLKKKLAVSYNGGRKVKDWCH